MRSTNPRAAELEFTCAGVPTTRVPQPTNKNNCCVEQAGGLNTRHSGCPRRWVTRAESSKGVELERELVHCSLAIVVIVVVVVVVVAVADAAVAHFTEIIGQHIC